MPNIINRLRGALALALLTVFTCGIVPLGPLDVSMVEARAKKSAKKKTKAKTKKKKKKVRKKKKKAARRTARQPKTLYRPPVYRLPARASTLSQKYYLKEKIGGAQSESVVEGLKGLGVEEASVDIPNNSVQVKYGTQSLNSISIIKKLKELGFTVRRID